MTTTPGEQPNNPFDLNFAYCQHYYDAEFDIHTVKLPPTREGVAELLMIFEVLNQRQPPSGLNRLMTEADGRVIPPLSQIFKRAREFKRLYPNQAPYRMAVLVSQRTTFMNLVDSFMQLLRTTDIIRSFESEEAALDWLRTTR